MDETQIIKAGIEVAKAPIEIIKVPFGGASMVFQMTMSGAYGLSAIAQFGQAIKQKLDYEKAIGGTDLQTLLDVSGGDVQLIKIPENDFEKVKQALIDYKIPHSLAPEIEGGKKPTIEKNGEEEKAVAIMFPTNATPRVSLILEELGFGEVESPEEYVQKADVPLLPPPYDPEAPTEKLITNNQMLSNIPVENPAGILTVDSLPPEQKRVLEQQQIKMKLADESKQAFSLNIEKLVISQDEESVLTRIPGIDNYVRFPKREAFIIDDNQTLLVFADKKAEVSVFDNLNQHIETTNFERLHKLHYDRVAQMSRRRMQHAKTMQTIKPNSFPV